MNPKKMFFVMMALVGATFIISLAPAFAQIYTAWVKRWDGYLHLGDCAHDIAVDDSGNVYVTGYANWSDKHPENPPDWATVKYTPNGGS